MTNALQLNTSTVTAGLNTQSYTVTTAGLYTLSFKYFIPYLAAGSPAVTTNPVAEIQTVTTVADSSGSLNNTYFTVYSPGNLQGFYVWMNINSAGTDPAVSGLTGIEVDGATGVTANNLATAIRTALKANTAFASYFNVTGSTNAVILNSIQVGSCTAAADSASPTGFTFAVGTTGAYGTPAISGLDIVVKQNSTVLGRYGFPTPTQPIMGGSVVIQASAADVISIITSSLSTADAGLNAVKGIVNLYQGIGG